MISLGKHKSLIMIVYLDIRVREMLTLLCIEKEGGGGGGDTGGGLGIKT